MLNDVGGVVQHQIHDLRIVLVDLDRDAMRLGISGQRA
jgi:heat shock protein HspQ